VNLAGLPTPDLLELHAILRKYNPYHDETGRFSDSPGGGSFPADIHEPPVGLDNQKLTDHLTALPGDAVVRMYHGTTATAAQSIVSQMHLKPDDIISVGLAADYRTARSYGLYHTGFAPEERRNATVVEVAVRRSELGKPVDAFQQGDKWRVLEPEVGGTGENSVLVYGPNGVDLVGARIAVRKEYTEELHPRDERGHWTDSGASDIASTDRLTLWNRKFTYQGGEIIHDAARGDITSAKVTMSEMSTMLGKEWKDEPGTVFTNIAMQQDHCILAVEKSTGVSGALGYSLYADHTTGFSGWLGQNYGPARLHVDWLGTTGITDGAGSALAREAIGIAAAKGISISLEPTKESVGWWTKVGMTQDPWQLGSDLYGMTSAGVKAADQALKDRFV
jgi:hypothetical protein